MLMQVYIVRSGCNYDLLGMDLVRLWMLQVPVILRVCCRIWCSLFLMPYGSYLLMFGLQVDVQCGGLVRMWSAAGSGMVHCSLLWFQVVELRLPYLLQL